MRDALDQARQFFKDKAFDRALVQYEYFFDHALEQEPSLYGVRLSYCLDEWARLGAKYPPALRRLEERTELAAALLLETRNPERFQDYRAMCRYLKRDGDPTALFLKLHTDDRELAKTIVRFAWDALVETGHWAVCSVYLPDPKESYAKYLYKFDKSMEVCDSDPSLGGAEFEAQIEGWYVRDVTNLMQVMRNDGRELAAAELLATATEDMRARGRANVIARVNERLALG